MKGICLKKKKCKSCKKEFTPTQPLQQVCCYQCAILLNKEKQAKDKKQSWTKEKLEMKDKLKTLSDWKNELQREINVLVREIDKGHGCIATNSNSGQMQAGHYYSVGSNPTLRFHLENIWLQSMHSNSWKSGDTLRYQQGIIETFGKHYLDYMNSLQSIEPLKLTADDIKPKIPLVRSLIKWVKLQDKKFTNEERIFLRKEFNEKIGIYGRD